MPQACLNLRFLVREFGQLCPPDSGPIPCLCAGDGQCETEDTVLGTPLANREPWEAALFGGETNAVPPALRSFLFDPAVRAGLSHTVAPRLLGWIVKPAFAPQTAMQRAASLPNEHKEKPRLWPNRRGVRGFYTERLEDHLGSQLKSSGVIGACDLAHISTADCAVDASTVYVSTELGVVPNVVGLETEFGM